MSNNRLNTDGQPSQTVVLYVERCKASSCFASKRPCWQLNRLLRVCTITPCSWHSPTIRAAWE